MAQCLLTINFQRLLCTVINFHVVKGAKEAVLFFLQDFRSNSILTAKFIDLSLLIDYSTYIRDVIRYYFCQFSPVSAKKRLLTIQIKEMRNLFCENEFYLHANEKSFPYQTLST